MSGRILVFTGDGKGKTTAALGMVLRACGHGLRCRVIQFLKSDETTGEVLACRNLGVDVVVGGLGFVPKAGHPAFEAHRSRAVATLALARYAVAEGGPDLVVLDEILGAVQRGLVAEADVLALLDGRRPDGVLVLTGRGGTPAVLERADTVTEMRCLAHGYEAGFAAQKGVEF